MTSFKMTLTRGVVRILVQINKNYLSSNILAKAEINNNIFFHNRQLVKKMKYYTAERERLY